MIDIISKISIKINKFWCNKVLRNQIVYISLHIGLVSYFSYATYNFIENSKCLNINLKLKKKKDELQIIIIHVFC